MDRNRNRIIVSELPYMTNKTNLIERIAQLTRDEVIEGVTDLRDESDRQGMRIVIELTKNADPEQVLQTLFKRTTMRGTFGIIMLALVNGEPRLLSLKQALKVYLEHRLTVVRRQSEYDLERAKQRAHILEGLRIALKEIDEVIALIRKSRTAETAKNNLMRAFKLSDDQAQAILDTPLRRLASLERKKVEEEYKTAQATIKELSGLLRSPKKMRAVVSKDLLAIKEKYSDPRRTLIVQLEEGESKSSVLTASDIIPDKTTWVSVTPDGLISRTPENRLPRLSGRAAPGWVLRANTRDTLYLVTEGGEAAAVAVHVVPETRSPDEGTPFYRVSPLTENDLLGAILCLPPKEHLAGDWYTLTVSRDGMVKKSAISELPGPSAKPFTFVKVNEGDRLGWIRLTDGNKEILMATAHGMAIRFSEEDVRPMGLVAAGVMGIKLKEGDEVVGVALLPQKYDDIFVLRSDGQAKRVKSKHFPVQGRYGQGVIAWKLPEKMRLVGIAAGKGTTRGTVHLLRLAPKSVRFDDAPYRTRPSRGKTVVEVKSRDQAVDLTVPWDPPRPTEG
jgi:DNA gyrase subunit A